MYRLVCVEPGRKPKLLVFARTGSFYFIFHPNQHGVFGLHANHDHFRIGSDVTIRTLTGSEYGFVLLCVKVHVNLGKVLAIQTAFLDNANVNIKMTQEYFCLDKVAFYDQIHFFFSDEN